MEVGTHQITTNEAHIDGVLEKGGSWWARLRTANENCESDENELHEERDGAWHTTEHVCLVADIIPDTSHKWPKDSTASEVGR